MNNINLQSRETSSFLPRLATQDELTSLRKDILSGSIAPPLRWQKYRLVDGILIGQEVVWNGDAFSTPNHKTMIYSLTGGIASAISTNTVADTVFTTIKKVTIPGFLMGKTSILTIESRWLHLTSPNLRHMAIKVSGVLLGVVSSPLHPSIAPLGGTYLKDSFSNLSSYNSQFIGSISHQGITQPDQNLSVDTTSEFDIEFAVSWGSVTSNDTLNLDSLSIWLQPFDL